VPIIPDESRTFGMDSLFRDAGIYAHSGQLYEPVDKETLMFYNEKKDGIIIEEGITEAGSMASFMAAGLSHENFNRPMIPFYFFYSMFGFQRVGDLIWAAADARVRGFLIGGVSGRTTLSGEGLQHQDGHSHTLAMSIPNLKAYDPSFAFELAVIIRNGIKEMYVDQKDVFYYVTIVNAAHKMPEMPGGVEDEILNGLYKFKASQKRKNKNLKVHLLGSGAIMKEVMHAAEQLEKEFDVPVDIWSVTSYKALYENVRDVERSNYLSDAQKRKSNIVQDMMKDEQGVFVAASDYQKVVPLTIVPYLPGSAYVLGTDGFGKSDTTENLRTHFEVSASFIMRSAFKLLLEEGKIKKEDFKKFIGKIDVDKNKENPAEY